MAPGRLDENSPWRYSFPLQQRPLETVPLRISSLPTIFSPSAVDTTRPLQKIYRFMCPLRGSSGEIYPQESATLRVSNPAPWQRPFKSLISTILPGQKPLGWQCLSGNSSPIRPFRSWSTAMTSWQWTKISHGKLQQAGWTLRNMDLNLVMLSL